MQEQILFAILAINLLLLVLIFVFRPRGASQLDVVVGKLQELRLILENLDSGLKKDFQLSRDEISKSAQGNREELGNTLKNFGLEQKATFQTVDQNLDRELKRFQEAFERNVLSFNNLQKEKFQQLEIKQTEMIKNTEDKLNQIRSTVEEKLEQTLSQRLGQSFETVGKQLIEVQRGLGEMQVLAQDVGGLKRVLSNVKMRGGIGEVQLQMLLEQILAPEQYAANVKTKEGSRELVEFAVKLPGRGEQNSALWLPIDAKFPRDVYEHLQNAYDTGEPDKITEAQRTLEGTIKNMASDICDKYIDPPNTTDFAIMFLPFEGIFSEVVRKASLIEEVRQKHKVIITGPTTLAAILNSLQMGFKTLAIERRSSEVWRVLGAVKTEFNKFGGLLQKAQVNLQTGMNQLDEVMGVRTRQLQRKLEAAEKLGDQSNNLNLSAASVAGDNGLDEESE